MPPTDLNRSKIPHRLRLGATVVLALGLATGAVVYATGHESSAPSQSDEPLPLLDSKSDTRALEEQQGKSGILMVKLRDEMQRPGVLALVIAGSATVVALVLFRAAEWFASEPRGGRGNHEDSSFTGSRFRTREQRTQV